MPRSKTKEPMDKRALSFILYPSELFKIITPHYYDVYQMKRDISGYSIQDDFQWLDDPKKYNSDVELMIHNKMTELLYNDSYRFDVIASGYRYHYAYIIHNRDIVYDQLEDDSNPVIQRAKKVHIHLIVMYPEGFKSSSWKNEASHFLRKFNHVKPYVVYQKEMRHKEYDIWCLNPIYNLCEPVVFLDKALRYLIHLGFPMKTQYRFDELISDEDLSHYEAFQGERRNKAATMILSFIRSGACTDYSELMQWVIENDLIKEYKYLANEYKTAFFNECEKRSISMKQLSVYQQFPEMKPSISLQSALGLEPSFVTELAELNHSLECFYSTSQYMEPGVPTEQFLFINQLMEEE